jgi:putative ubiquitin-RnfH superfamily antitoxin RatB of RatAB toxin-antitoxin module
MAENEDATLQFVVQVCFAPPPPAAPVMIDLFVAPGTTLAQAITISGVAARIEGLDPVLCRTGIWGKLRPLETRVREHDRIEIYRPLIADPKEARRKRARGKVTK